MPAAKPLMSAETAADIHDISVTLKLLLAQQLSRPGIPFDAVLGQVFGEGGYENMKRFLDAGPGDLRAVA
jgi:hypothetical protein